MVWDRGKCFEVFTNKYLGENGLKLRNLFERTAVDLCESTFKLVGAPYWFTDHGIQHSDHVFYFALQIANAIDEWVGRLSEIEAMALASACYLHDISMAHLPQDFRLMNGWTHEDIMKIRSWHVTGIGEILPKYREKLKPLYEWQPILEDVLPMVCKAHGTDTHERMCDEFRKKYKSYTQFRGDLLGKILLLADEFDLTEHRSMINRHPQFEQFPLMAKAHQFKHHYILNVNCHLPLLRYIFVFPEEMTKSDRESFMSWTCQKLRKQINLVSEGLVSQYLQAFEIDLQPEEGTQRIQRVLCPPEVINVIKSSISNNETKTEKIYEITICRPNDFRSDRLNQQEPGVISPILRRLMDDFFKECDTPEARKFFKKIYIKVDNNVEVGNELMKLLNKYSEIVRQTKNIRKLPSQEVFAITGAVGTGKTSLLLHLENMGILGTRFKRGNEMIVVHIDCLNLRNFVEVLRAMLVGLTGECKKKSRIWKAIQKGKWIKYLDPITDAYLLPKDDTLSCLRGLLDLLHLRVSKNFKGVVPVCFILDNIDRMPSFELKQETVAFAAKESKSRGFPLFVVTLRYITKHMIDNNTGEIPPIPTHSISSPTVEEVLKRRLDAAFSKEVVGKIASWSKPISIKTFFGTIHLSYRDIRKALVISMITLTKKDDFKHTGFIPSMAGNNIRSALTLYRVIIKSIDDTGLYILSMGLAREHTLIKCAMLEGNVCYFESISKIRNIFRLSYSGHYFARLYMLKSLELLQINLPDEGFVDFKEWKRIIGEIGMNIKNFTAEVWELLCGELSLLEIEGTEDTIPNDKFRSMDDIKNDIGIRISSAGKYYLSWLIFDFAYLRYILQDTSMDVELAKDIGKPQKTMTESVRQVEKFINYLQTKEVEERIGWHLNQDVKQFIPELWNRFELQKKKLLSGKTLNERKIDILSISAKKQKDNIFHEEFKENN